VYALQCLTVLDLFLPHVHVRTVRGNSSLITEDYVSRDSESNEGDTDKKMHGMYLSYIVNV